MEIEPMQSISICSGSQRLIFWVHFDRPDCCRPSIFAIIFQGIEDNEALVRAQLPGQVIADIIYYKIINNICAAFLPHS